MLRPCSLGCVRAQQQLFLFCRQYSCSCGVHNSSGRGAALNEQNISPSLRLFFLPVTSPLLPPATFASRCPFRFRFIDEAFPLISDGECSRHFAFSTFLASLCAPRSSCPVVTMQHVWSSCAPVGEGRALRNGPVQFFVISCIGLVLMFRILE